MNTRSQRLSGNNDAGQESPGATVATIGEAAGERLDQARERIVEGAETARQRAETFLRSRPYQSIALAVGIGALLGFILGRQRNDD